MAALTIIRPRRFPCPCDPQDCPPCPDCPDESPCPDCPPCPEESPCPDCPEESPCPDCPPCPPCPEESPCPDCPESPGDCPPTGIWDENVEATDALAVTAGDLAEPVNVDDAFTATPTFDEDANVDDSFTAAVADLDEDAQAADALAPTVNLDEPAQADDSYQATLAMDEDVQAEDPWRADATAAWDENAEITDVIVVSLADLAEPANVDDLLASHLTMDEDANVPDAIQRINLADLAENIRINDLARADITTVGTVRTGTPASDFYQDAHVAQNQATTNFGNAVEMEVFAPGLGGNQRDGLIQLDFTRLANWSGRDGGGGNALVIQIRVRKDDLLGTDLRVSAGAQAAKPFTEDAVTWNTRPARPTSLKNREAHPIVQGVQTVTLNFTVAQVTNNIAGNWLLIYLESSGSGISEDRLFVRTREHGTPAERPVITRINLQRGT